MCKHCCEKFSDITQKIMLFCDMKTENINDMECICTCQRFCSELDKYIAYKQREGCKNYED